MQNKVSHSTINVRTFWISKYDLDKAYIHEMKKLVILNSCINYLLPLQNIYQAGNIIMIYNLPNSA